MRYIREMDVLNHVVLLDDLEKVLRPGDSVKIIEMWKEGEFGIMYGRSVPEDMEIHIPVEEGKVHVAFDDEIIDRLGSDEQSIKESTENENEERKYTQGDLEHLTGEMEVRGDE